MSKTKKRHLMEAGIQTLHEEVGVRIQQAMKSYASQQCEEQRKICAKEVECGDGEPDFMKTEIKAIRELVISAPEPPSL